MSQSLPHKSPFDIDFICRELYNRIPVPASFFWSSYSSHRLCSYLSQTMCIFTIKATLLSDFVFYFVWNGIANTHFLLYFMLNGDGKSSFFVLFCLLSLPPLEFFKACPTTYRRNCVRNCLQFKRGKCQKVMWCRWTTVKKVLSDIDIVGCICDCLQLSRIPTNSLDNDITLLDGSVYGS